MTPYEGSRVRASLLMQGYASAVERFNEAASHRAPEPAFFALFEALNWAVAADDVIAEVWRPEGRREGFEWRERVEHSDVMDGVRLARNLVHHHWADALDLVDGARYPRRYPRRYFAWIWRRSNELPPPTRRWDVAKVPIYDELLADHPAENTLIKLGQAFDRVATFLDPPRAKPPGS